MGGGLWRRRGGGGCYKVGGVFSNEAGGGERLLYIKTN